MEQPLESQSSNLDIHSLLWRVRRYGWLLVLPLVLSLSLAAIYYRITPPTYESNVVLVVAERSPVSAAMEGLVRTDRGTDNPRERVSLVESRIRSRAFLEVLVDRLGVLRNPEFMKRAAEQAARMKGMTATDYAMRAATVSVGKRIRVLPGQGQLIRVVVSNSDPEGARRTAAAIGDLLVEEARRAALAGIQARGEFSSDQIAVYEERLRNSEERLRAQEEATLRRNLAFGGTVNEENVETARIMSRTAEAEMDQVRGRIEAQRGELRSEVPNAGFLDLATPRSRELERRLGELEASHAVAELQGRGGTSSEVTTLQSRIAATRQALFVEYEEKAVQSAPESWSPTARSAAAGIALDRSVLRSLQQKKDRLSRIVSEFMSGAAASPRDNLTLQRLREEVQGNRELVLAFKKEATSSRLGEALVTSDLAPRIDVVERPLLPLKPVAPDPLKIFGIALLLGPLVSGAVVFAGEKLGAVVRTTEQAEEELGARVIATVPRIEGWPRPGGYIRNHWAAYAVLAVVVMTVLFFAVQGMLLSGQGPANATIGLLP